MPLRLLLPQLLLVIKHMFNTLITTSLFHSHWEHAQIITDPKSSNIYSSVYVQSIRNKHICITALTDVSDHIWRNFDNDNLTFLILIDNLKALDCVLYSKLTEQVYFSSTACIYIIVPSI